MWIPWELGGIFLGNEQMGFLGIPESLQHLLKKYFQNATNQVWTQDQLRAQAAVNWANWPFLGLHIKYYLMFILLHVMTLLLLPPLWPPPSPSPWPPPRSDNNNNNNNNNNSDNNNKDKDKDNEDNEDADDGMKGQGLENVMCSWAQGMFFFLISFYLFYKIFFYR